MSVEEFLDVSDISKRTYYAAKSDDSILEIGHMSKICEVFNISYLELQIQLGRVERLETTYPMKNELANNIIYSNSQYFKMHGLDINCLSIAEKKDLAIMLDIQIQLLSSFYSK